MKHSVKKITAKEAMAFFQDKSQRIGGLDPENLHDDGLLFYASGPVCGIAHYGFEEGVWMVHYGVKREGLGKYDGHMLSILKEHWNAVKAKLIIGWTPESNKLALSIAKRIGFKVVGYLDLDDRIVMQEWKKGSNHGR